MSQVAESTHSEEWLRGAIELLAGILVLFAGIKIVSTGLSFVAAVIAVGGNDADGSRTLYWVPQLLFYTFFFTSARRLRRFEALGRRAVVSLSWFSLVIIVLYTVSEFAIGPGRENPPMVIGFKLRMLFTGGDVWDILFPALAILWLRGRAVARLFERE